MKHTLKTGSRAPFRSGSLVLCRSAVVVSGLGWLRLRVALSTSSPLEDFAEAWEGSPVVECETWLGLSPEVIRKKPCE